MGSQFFPRNKFQLILRFWNFAENENSAGGRLSKIMPLVVQPCCCYTPDRKLSIDESMMLWIGRLILRHYIRNKKHKYGIKFYELCESGGIVMNVKIYSGEPTPDIHWLGQTGVIVLNLMENFLGKGYQLYIVTSIIHLNKQSTCSHIGGTLRSDRKSNPKEVMRAKLKKGDVVSRSRDGVIASK